MSKPIIAVVGATGMQGGGVVDALLERRRFAVRALTRSPDSERAKELAARGVEVLAADLHDAASLERAFAGAHGAFVVTNFWDPTTGARELELGSAATSAAKAAGVKHFVWSTLPDVDALSKGMVTVDHFTNKAAVDPVVAAAGFEHHTFVEPPMYFQNFTSMMGPQPLGDGRRGWAVPMDPANKSLHMGDVRDVGRVVARAFESPDAAGSGQHLGVAPGVISWDDFVATLNGLGHDLHVKQVPGEVYDDLFPGAEEMRRMFQWFEGFTYYGPDADTKLANTRAVYPEPLTSLADWAADNMPAT